MSGARGFSLVELMVTMTITMIIMAGAFRVFQDARTAVTAGSTLAATTQDLRAAVNLVSRDLIQTGRLLPQGGIATPSGTGALSIKRPGPPGTDLSFPVTFDNHLPSICPGPDLGPVINGVATDLVTTVYVDDTLDLNQFDFVKFPTGGDGSQMTVNAGTNINDAATGIRAGDLIYFSNGLGSAVQTVSSVQGQVVYFATGDAFRLNQRTAPAGTILNLSTGSASSRTWTNVSGFRILMITYYIDTVTRPGQFRLVRRIGFGPARLIATGIENLQATYDIRDDNDNPTNQPDAVDPNDPSQIRKVNLFISGRSALPLSPNRGPLRLSIATQVSLRAMSFFKEYK
jgi:prepilin-type N-terminal cleavage/methylation domain-containing protein